MASQFNNNLDTALTSNYSDIAAFKNSYNDYSNDTCTKQDTILPNSQIKFSLLIKFGGTLESLQINIISKPKVPSINQ